MNKSQNQNVFSTLSQPQNTIVSHFRSFYRPKWQISLPFRILQLVKSLPYHIPEAWKRYPFRKETLRIGRQMRILILILGFKGLNREGKWAVFVSNGVMVWWHRRHLSTQTCLECPPGVRSCEPQAPCAPVSLLLLFFYRYWPIIIGFYSYWPTFRKPHHRKMKRKTKKQLVCTRKELLLQKLGMSRFISLVEFVIFLLFVCDRKESRR